MNEIEKMYKNAGIEPVIRDNAIGRGYYIEHQRIEDYPPFTAEKELRLIKWYAHSGHFSHQTDYLPWLVDNIARNINFLWDALTPEGRQQIKEILGG